MSLNELLLFLKEDADAVCVQEALAEEVMKIYLLQNQDGSVEPTDVDIIIEGITEPVAVCWDWAILWI